MCQSWFYKAPNPPLRKADHLSLAIGDMVLNPPLRKADHLSLAIGDMVLG